MKKIKTKVWLVLVLLIILIASVIPLRRHFYTQKIAKEFYAEYYFPILDDSSEASLAKHFQKIPNQTITISAEDLSKINESYAKLIKKTNKKDDILNIQVLEPYLDKNIKASWTKKSQ